MNRARSLFIILLVGASAIILPSHAFADPNATVAATVQSYFADIPIMIAIAKCESGPRQFAADGTPLVGGDGGAVGIFQIEASHYEEALALGFDINTVPGNLGYARYLYGAEGTAPWISSFGCWNGATTTASTSSPTSLTVVTGTPALTLNLTLGSVDPQLLILQQLLNQAGFTVATSGPGSPGNETTKFGALTYAALKKFQCAQGIACSGDEATTGYGFLNAPTRAALLAITSTVAPNASTSAPAASTSTVTDSASSTPTSSSVSLIPPPAATSSAQTAIIGSSVSSDAAEIAELQSRIAALVAIVAQLETEIAAR